MIVKLTGPCLAMLVTPCSGSVSEQKAIAVSAVRARTSLKPHLQPIRGRDWVT